MDGTIEQLPFGRTGHTSSRVIFGAATLSSMRPERAAGVLELLLERGVNHIDTAASYGDSELRVGEWFGGDPSLRERFFLATKTGERTGPGARAELERSLERLQVGSVDLIQLHNLVEDDEWAVALGRGGAVDALEQARAEGLVRHIGVTGHGTRIARMHLRSLARHPFDSVLLPYSYVAVQDPAYRADVDELLEMCAAGEVAVQTIKGVARRRWPDDHEGRRFSWYEPLPADDGSLARAVRWVLARPGVFLNTTSDGRVLPAVLEAAASGGGAPSDEEMAADLATLDIQPLFDGSELERI